MSALAPCLAILALLPRSLESIDDSRLRPFLDATGPKVQVVLASPRCQGCHDLIEQLAVGTTAPPVVIYVRGETGEILRDRARLPRNLRAFRAPEQATELDKAVATTPWLLEWSHGKLTGCSPPRN